MVKKEECKFMEYTRRIVDESSFEDDKYPKHKSYGKILNSCNCPRCVSEKEYRKRVLK